MKPSHQTDRIEPNGFVLAEMLIVVALCVALVSIALPFAGQLIARWRHGQSAIEQAEAWIRLTTRMSADLAQAVPLPVPGGRQAQILFRATSDHVVFVQPAYASYAMVGLQITAYQLEHGANGDTVVNYSTPFSSALADTDPRTIGTATAIFTSPLRLSFTLIDSEGGRQNAWLDRDDLPVRVELAASSRERTAPLPTAIVLPIIARAPKRTTPPTQARR